MNTTADKLTGILNSKEAIRQAIISKGQSCPSSTLFADYASLISNISTGEDLYKSVSVDSNNNTWTGYKLIKNSNNTYSYDNIITSGLTFTTLVPEVGKIYSNECLFELNYLNMKIDDYVFYAPLSSSQAYAQTGQTLSETGNISFNSYSNKNCAYFDGNSYITTSIPQLSGEFTFAFMFNTQKQYVNTGGRTGTFFHTGEFIDASGLRCQIYKTTNGEIKVCCDNINDPNVGLTSPFEADTWIHCAISSNGTNSILYINGEISNNNNMIYALNNILNIGNTSQHRNTDSYIGYLADFMLFSRVLDQYQIKSLVNNLK